MDDKSQQLREQARDELRKGKIIDPSLYEKDLKVLVEELSVYQIELEHQNQELIKSQEEIQQVNDRYVDLFDNAPISYLIVDANGVIKDTNQTACLLFESNKHDFTGTKITKIIHPDYQDIYYIYFRTLIKQKHNQTCDIKLQKANNTFFYARIQGIHQTSFATKEPEFRLAIIDITIQKEMELKLLIAKEHAEESELQFRQLFESAADAIFIANTENGTIIDVNQAAERLMQMPKNDIVGLHQSKLHPPSAEKFTRDAFRIDIQVINESNPTNLIETKVVRFDGTEVPVEILATKTKYKGIDCLVGTFRDITERKKTELELKLLSRAIEASYVSVIITDAEGNINYVNSYFTELTGYSLDEMLGKKLRTLKTGKLSGSDHEVLWNEILSGKDWIGEYQNSKKNGELYWEKAVISPILDSNGVITNFVAINEDITEFKKLEIAKIENHRLNVAGELSASIAHDFNNSLQSILGSLELAMNKSELPESAQNILNNTINLVLDVSGRIAQLQKFNAKKQSAIQFSEINLNKIITDVINQTKPLWKDEAEKKGVDIEIHTNLGEVLEIKGIASDLSAAIYNIIKNSIEAIPKSGQIWIFSGKSPEGFYVTFKDNGIGMDEDTKTRIFQPYFTTKGYELGRGLGMSGVFRIIKEHDGKIFVKESKPGEGTTIEILFPV